MLLLPLFMATCALAASWETSALRNIRGPGNLVAFGDSYTDGGRLQAYLNNGGRPPPPGTSTAGSNSTPGGGYSWGYYAVEEMGARYYDYAVSGAFCTNQLFTRWNSALNRSFPAVLDDEVPSFQLEIQNQTFYPDRKPDNTLYALWIGTNDLGTSAFLTDAENGKPVTITDFVDCIWDVFDAVYESGGRHFVLLNQAPLQYTPLYAPPEHFGVLTSDYWSNKSSYNMTEYAYKMKEYTTNVNTMLEYGVPFYHVVQNRWAEASITIFDVHQLISDIYWRPEQYLDAPANSTGFYRHCGTTCSNSKNPRSSFLWNDELHPTSKADQIIASEFVKLVKSESKYATYW